MVMALAGVFVVLALLGVFVVLALVGVFKSVFWPVENKADTIANNTKMPIGMRENAARPALSHSRRV